MYKLSIVIVGKFPNLIDISHPAKPRSKVSEETAKVWTLSANDVLDNGAVSILCGGLF